MLQHSEQDEPIRHERRYDPIGRPMLELREVVGIVLLCTLFMAVSYFAGPITQTIAGIVSVLAIAVSLYRYSQSASTVAVFGVLVVGGWLVMFVLPGMYRAGLRDGGPHGEMLACQTNMRMILIALQGYHAEYGAYPPAYVVDKKSQTLHSWRVLLLPYLEEEELYRRYRFNERWNSPHNLEVARSMPPVYRCPGAPAPGRYANENDALITPYVAVVGPGTMWPGLVAIADSDVPDGLAETAQIVEWVDSPVVWTKPQDLRIDSPLLLKGRHGGKLHVGFADGHVSRLPSEQAVATLWRLFQRNDGASE